MSTHINPQTILSHSEEEMKTLARKIAEKSKIHRFICLYGELGSGKTVFSKGFAHELGISEREIKSPTYTFVRCYTFGKKTSAPKTPQKLYHFDFYRINEPDELMIQDLEEIFSQKNAIILVEWPERINKLLPKKRIDIFFKYKNKTDREIRIEEKSEI